MTSSSPDTPFTSAQQEALTSAMRSVLRGGVIARGDPEYNEARKVWNGMIDRRPAVIARCADTADVQAAVRVAQAHRPPLSIRGGGHQIAGSAVCDDGLVIDLSAMKQIEVDPQARTVRAGGGVLWGELDAVTQAHGLATTGGEVSTTGIAGFTLGGGMGFFMRALGLACDRLRSVEVVTPDGEIRQANATDHSDLFWAARGGGRGIGVVTTFEFDLEPIGPEVAFAQVIYPIAEAASILERWPEVALGASEAVAPELLLWRIPPTPVFPEELHDQQVVIVAAVYAGAPDEADTALAPLRELGTPLLDMSGTAPYVEVQSGFDEVFPHGIRCYMKSHFLDELSPDAIRTLLECNAGAQDHGPLVALRTLRGAVSRPTADESAYPYRDAAFNLSFDAGWFDPERDASMIRWCRDSWDRMQPFSTGGVYVNFSGFGDEADVPQSSVYGDGEARLDAVRAKYDPEGLFAGAARRP